MLRLDFNDCACLRVVMGDELRPCANYSSESIYGAMAVATGAISFGFYG